MSPVTSSPMLPDMAVHRGAAVLPLDWVGMRGIAQPICLVGNRVSAWADIGVNLIDGQSRGIHMSRLYLALNALASADLTPVLLRQLLGDFIESHVGLSDTASIKLRFDQMVERPALISGLTGWKRYPVTVEAKLSSEMFHVELSVEIPYSSTCPCSAALARQLIQAQFREAFSGETLEVPEVEAWLGSSAGIVATPHSQRSMARVRVRLSDTLNALPILTLLNTVENALGTAVQTAVKRVDEQAFALANGQNLMFCEDAARRVHGAVRALEWVRGFELEVIHAESLHAHDAVATSAWQW